ncbi:unnamed protein product [Scytosiphon promiscuus]
MSFDLSLDEMSVALGFIGIGAPAPVVVAKKKKTRKKMARAAEEEVPQTKAATPMISTARATREPVIAVCRGLVPPSRMQEEEEDEEKKEEEPKKEQEEDGKKNEEKQEDMTLRGITRVATPMISGEERKSEENPVAADDDVHGGVSSNTTISSPAQEIPTRGREKDVKAKLVDNYVSNTSRKMAVACDISFDEMAMALSYISLGSAAAAPASSARGLPSSTPAKKEKKAKKVEKPAADDDMDDLFGDDEEAAAPPAKEESRADKMAAAKAAKDAKKKVDRSQIVFEVKPWDTETDLKGLFAKIRATEIPGLVWGEAHKLVPVAFGVKKLVLSCVVEDDKVGVEDITDVIEAFDEEVQSVDMTTMNRL